MVTFLNLTDQFFRFQTIAAERFVETKYSYVWIESTDHTRYYDMDVFNRSKMVASYSLTFEQVVAVWARRRTLDSG